MYRPTISIRMMLAVVAFIALACTALVWANGIWATTLFTAALGVLLFAVLVAILRRGVKQAFWIGFALFGWGYLWMAHWPSGAYWGGHRPWKLQSDATGTLATTHMLIYLHENWLDRTRSQQTSAAQSAMANPISTTAESNATDGAEMISDEGSEIAPTDSVANDPASAVTNPASTGSGGLGGYGGMGGMGMGGMGMGFQSPPIYDFTRVGHSLFIIVFALVGGCLGAILYRTRDAKEKPPASTGG